VCVCAFAAGLSRIHKSSLQPDFSRLDETNQAQARSALQLYDAVAIRIINDVNGRSHLETIKTALLSFHAEKSFPKAFLLLDGPSGVGKTQLVFALREYLKESCLTGYFPMTRTSNSQYIYRGFSRISLTFNEAVNSDLSAFFKPGEPGLFPSIENFQLDHEYATLTFFGRLFFDDDKVKTISDLRESVARLGKPCIIFLDEVPRIQMNQGRFVAFSRNVLRLSGVIPVLLGTDSSAVNIIEVGKHSSEARNPGLWAKVITTFPEYLPPDHVSHDLRLLLRNGNSRLNTFFLQELCKQGVDVASVTTLDIKVMLEVCKATEKAAVESKPNLREAEGLRGYFCMSNAAYFHDVDDSFPPRVGDKRNQDQYQSCVSSLVISHFADLSSRSLEQAHSSEPVPPRKRIIDIQIKGGRVVLLGTQTPFDPVAIYRSTKESPLMYLILMSNELFVYHKGDQLTVLKMMSYLAQSNIVSWDPHNPNARVETGMVQESKVCVAIIVASHICGFEGVPLDQFLTRLMTELGAKKRLDLNRHQLPNLLVPFLGPANQQWPQYLQQLMPGCQLGDIQRSKNSDEIDLVVNDLSGQKVFVGEAKDRQNISTKLIQSIVTKGLRHQVPFEIIFARTLQTKYFTKDEPEEDVVDTLAPKRAKKASRSMTWPEFLQSLQTNVETRGIMPVLLRVSEDLKVNELFDGCTQPITGMTWNHSRVFLFVEDGKWHE
jgi:hypothetical protein